MHAATTASAVLNCDGALPKLLELLETTSDAAKLNSSLLAASAQVTLTHVPSLDEIKAVIERVSTLTARANILPLKIFDHVQCTLHACAHACMYFWFGEHVCC